jgi:hypothetical protein
MVRDIENDIGGRGELSRIEGELVRAFAGAATLLQSRNVEIALGETSEVDPATYAALASTMLRIGARLGFRRRAKDITPSFGDLLRQDIQRRREQTEDVVVASDASS